MDQEEEDAASLFKNSLNELLKDLSYIGKTIQKKSDKMVTIIETSIKHPDCSDINTSETIGLGILSVLQTVHRNIIALSKVLETNLEKVRSDLSDQEQNLFTELWSKLLEYKNIITGDVLRNLNISATKCDREIQTDMNEINNINSESKIEGGDVAIKETVKEKSSQIESVGDPFTNDMTQDLLQRSCLSLQKKPERTNTQDTDDCWTDSLARSPTVVELWNKEYQGDKINATDEYWDQLKREQENEDWKKKTVDLNLNADNDSDDTFVDGHTPKREDPCAELDEAAKQESFVAEEHKIQGLDVDTTSNHTNSEDKSVGIENNSIADITNIPHEKDLNRDICTNTNDSKKIDCSDSVIDYTNPVPGCSKDINVENLNKAHFNDNNDNMDLDSEIEEFIANQHDNSDHMDTDVDENAVDDSLEMNLSQSTNEIDSDLDEPSKLDFDDQSKSECSNNYAKDLTQVLNEDMNAHVSNKTSNEGPICTKDIDHQIIDSTNGDTSVSECLNYTSELTQVLNENIDTCENTRSQNSNLANAENAVHDVGSTNETSVSEEKPHKKPECLESLPIERREALESEDSHDKQCVDSEIPVDSSEETRATNSVQPNLVDQDEVNKEGNRQAAIGSDVKALVPGLIEKELEIELDNSVASNTNSINTEVDPVDHANKNNSNEILTVDKTNINSDTNANKNEVAADKAKMTDCKSSECEPQYKPKSDNGEEIKKFSAPTNQPENTETSFVSSQIQSESPGDINNSENVPDLCSEEINESEEFTGSTLLDGKSNAKDVNSDDESQLTQIIDYPKDYPHCSSDNLKDPLKQLVTCEEVDEQSHINDLSQSIENDTPKPVHFKDGEISNIIDSCEGGGEQINQKTDNEKENISKVMQETKGMGESNLLDLDKMITESNEIANSQDLSQSSAGTEILDSDSIKNKHLELTTSQSQISPKLLSSVDEEKLQSTSEPSISKENTDPPHKGNDEDDTCSSKSFEFDINACLIERVYEQNEKLKDDLLEALEEVLCVDRKDKQCDNLDTTIKKSESKEDVKADIKETIEILSDSDDDVHLDVTMEEIISPGSSMNVEYANDQEDIQSMIDIQEIMPDNLNYLNEEIVKTASNKGNGLADELLELLREVEVSSEMNDIGVKRPRLSVDKADCKDADEIFKMLQEDSDSDSSSTDFSEEVGNLSSSDLEWIEDSGSNNKSIEVQKSDEVDSQKYIEKYSIKECYIAVERLEINEDEIVKINKKLIDSIDRLCDISNLLKKRKYSASTDTKSGLKRCKRPKQGTSDNSSDSESSSDSTDSEIEGNRQNCDTFSKSFPPPLEQKLDDMLANEICKVYKSNTSNESSDYDSDDSTKKTKKKKKDKHEDSKHSDSDKKEQLSKEEQRRKLWKNDPLLRGKLSSSESDTSKTSSSEKSRRQRNVLRSRYEHDTDYYIVSDSSSDSDSDATLQRRQNKVLMQEKTISPIKENLPISDSDNTDSEIEFVPQPKTPEKDVPEDDELPNSSQKGRRNIRSLLSNESLAEATQRANKEEQERIERLEDRHKIKESFSQSFSQKDDEEEDELILDVDVNMGEPVIRVHQGLNKKLKPHQRDGVQFMWDSCYESVERLKDHEGSGCILAHCMGLGKTFQVLTLIHTLFTHEVTNTKHVLVVCPLSTVNNWKKEVKIIFKDCPEEKFNVLTIADRKETINKYEIVKKWYLKRKCVLVMGYEGFETLTNECKLDKGGRNLRERMLEALIDPGPDLVICDEGHLLRNKKALKTMALNRIRTKRRIVLTGTPLQNNLLEYYYMVQFVKPNLLGNMKEFKTNFVNPITNGQYEDSTKDDIKLMMKRTHVLHKLLKKSIQRVEDTELKMYLPKIVDHAIFVQLHEVQIEMYNKFAELVKKNSTDNNRKGFLGDFVVFQYIGTHPYLLSVVDEMRNKKIKERDLITNEQEDNPICNIDGWWKAKVPEDAAEKIEYGNKLMVVKSILEECEEIGDKVLLFSQSLAELDVIEHFLKKVGTARCASWKKKVDYFRMDGTVCPEYRSVICDLFNDKDNKNIRLLLMSTKVGGLGLNLTAANRVIIMTVNWNPSLDTQSVFRVYRFGQEKAVFVYRLISLDTMEEKVYQRTVTKLAIAHRVVDKHQITRHYKSMDLQELYSCRPKADVVRTMPNLPEDLILGKLILALPCIFKYHEHQALLANRPEDNLNEQELNAAWDEFKRMKDAAKLPPPPPLQMQPANINGPTFANAYALTHSVQRAMGNSVTESESAETWLQQYYIPKTNVSGIQQKNNLPKNPSTANHLKVFAIKDLSTNLNTVHKNLNIPRDTVINVEDTQKNQTPGNHSKVSSNDKSSSNAPIRKPTAPDETIITISDNPENGLISIRPSTSNAAGVNQDPLYIPLKGKPVQTYNSLLKQWSNNQPISRLPKSTTVFLENNSQKNNQTENVANKNTKPPNIHTNQPTSTILIDDNVVVNNQSRKKERNVSSNENRLKRNCDDLSQDKDELIKKMKYQFNESQKSINLDDDDDVTEIADTNSDCGSLSNDIIQNLGLTGVSVHKVPKSDNIITLD